MKFNYRAILIGTFIFVISFLFIVKISMFAFAPLSQESSATPASSASTETTLIGNAYNAASSPTIIRTNSPQPANISRPSMISASSDNGQSSQREVMYSIIAIIGIVGMLVYMSRPRHKEWFLYEI